MTLKTRITLIVFHAGRREDCRLPYAVLRSFICRALVCVSDVLLTVPFFLFDMLNVHYFVLRTLSGTALHVHTISITSSVSDSWW